MRDLDRLEVNAIEQLDRWLERHHGQSRGLWLVTRRQGGSGPTVRYDDIVESCLCFGWIDSVERRLDDQRSMLRLSPRRPDSKWSASNRARVKQLERAGRMQPAGIQAVATARNNGCWDFLDDIEKLIVPEDLAEALDGIPAARHCWARFPASSRRHILLWIKLAKTDVTRARRIAETASKAACNIKANHPPERSAGPPEES